MERCAVERSGGVGDDRGRHCCECIASRYEEMVEVGRGKRSRLLTGKNFNTAFFFPPTARFENFHLDCDIPDGMDIGETVGGGEKYRIPDNATLQAIVSSLSLLRCPANSSWLHNLAP